MEKEPLGTLRRINFAVLVIGLTALAGMLGTLLAILTQAAGTTGDPHTRAFLARLAWACAAVLALTLVLLAWVLARYVAYRIGPGRKARRTKYVDAWALAGKRLKPPPEDEDDDQEGDSSPDRSSSP